MLLRCSGAVFVASADDHRMIRDLDVATLRGNVMPEFGLVAGRMGRERRRLITGLHKGGGTKAQTVVVATVGDR